MYRVLFAWFLEERVGHPYGRRKWTQALLINYSFDLFLLQALIVCGDTLQREIVEYGCSPQRVQKTYETQHEMLF